MKIVLVSSFFLPSIGGVEKQVEGIAQNLINRGHSVQVFCTDASHSKRRFTSNELKEVKRDYRIRFFRFIFGFGDFFRFAPSLLIRLLFTRFDVIHLHNIHDAHGLGVILIKLLRRKKLIITGHNPFMVDESKRGASLSRGVKFYEWVLKRFFRFVDGYIALLPSEKQTIVKEFKYPARKVSIVPNGIDESFYSNDLTDWSIFTELNIDRNKYDLVVGTVSRINFVKGIQNLKIAADTLPNVLFLLVGGDDGYLNYLTELYKSNTNVVFTNRYFDKDKVKKIYKELDIFLLPSVYEPFGMTIVEAMTQGTFIIATKNGGPKEILSETGCIIVDPANQLSIKDSIQRVLNKEIDLDKTSEILKKKALQYSWDKVIDGVINVYCS